MPPPSAVKNCFKFAIIITYSLLLFLYIRYMQLLLDYIAHLPLFSPPRQEREVPNEGRLAAIHRKW